mgnify:CR=1 FL=1
MILYHAIVREPAMNSWLSGAVENKFMADFGDLLHWIDKYNYRLIALHEIDFTKGTVKEFEDAEATFEAWKQGEDYEVSPAGIYDMRKRQVWP